MSVSHQNLKQAGRAHHNIPSLKWIAAFHQTIFYQLTSDSNHQSQTSCEMDHPTDRLPQAFAEDSSVC